MRDRTSHPPLSRRGDFLKIWGGQSVALLGFEISEMALPLLAILVLHAGASDLGLLNAARWLPFVLVSLWAGAWVERRRRIPVMIAADLGRAALLGVVVVLALAGVLNLPVLVAAVFLLGVMTVFFDVGHTTVLVSVVPREQLVEANGRLQASGSVAQVGGPGLGGLLVQWVTAPVTLLAQAGAFLVSAGFLSATRVEERVDPAPAGGPGAVAAVREGLAASFRDPLLRSLVGVGALFNMFSQWVVAMFPLFAVRDLGLSAGLMGLIVSVAAVGGLAGSMTVARLTARLGPGRVVVLSTAVASVPFVLVALTPERTELAVPWLIGAFAVAGYGWTVGGIMMTSLRQAHTPHGVLARVNATYRFLGSGLVAVGVFAGGLLGQATSLRVTLLAGAAGAMTAFAWSLVSPLRHLKEMPSQAQAVEEAR
ncbi:MFS transporter [Sphaerisporangium krabiense]|uniref:MFS family permease n=1 Tax=Sphaerisporangium krabiense TaxID=763782 RepID=A0A7W8Z2I1_9ACTN|nr:MFS transporter [Sphaerisporangium krabiense]MBB5626216.1 MFS family permease [Sphaerisporangium krabiense]GII66117.1 MFS transporter [Sphaerisporangium krabiense]